jgi:hypothetical protein
MAALTYAQWSLKTKSSHGQTLCSQGDQLQKLSDECRRLSLDALESSPKMRAVEKTVLAQLMRCKLLCHIDSCVTCKAGLAKECLPQMQRLIPRSVHRVRQQTCDLKQTGKFSLGA